MTIREHGCERAREVLLLFVPLSLVNLMDMLTMKGQILAYYHLSTKVERSNGLDWYETAYADCEKLSVLYGVSLDKVVGMVAALSPRNKWERNVSDVEQVLLLGERATVGTFKANKDKAIRIMMGEPILDVLKGNKVRAFYHCIRFFGSTHRVCVDGHAYAVACGYGERFQVKKISDEAYDEIERAYQQVAAELFMLPNQLQATTWLTYRRVHKIR